MNIPSRNEEVTENIPNNHKEVVKNIPSWQEESVNMPNSHDEVSGNIPIVRMWSGLMRWRRIFMNLLTRACIVNLGLDNIK